MASSSFTAARAAGRCFSLMPRLFSPLPVLSGAAAHVSSPLVPYASASPFSSSSSAADATPSTTSDTSSSSDSSSSAGPDAFLRKWRQLAPSTLTEPGFSTVDDTTTTATPTEIPDALTFSLFLPHNIMFKKKEVEMVLVPGTSGDFGVKPGHVPTIAQLRPGVLTIVHSEQEASSTKLFVAAGFVVVHPSSVCEISALEAVPLEDLDAETVKQGLSDYTAKLAAGGNEEYDNAVAQVGIEVHQAMNSALEQK